MVDKLVREELTPEKIFNKLNELADESVTPLPKLVASPYTLEQSDNNGFIYFNSPDGIVNIPSGLAIPIKVKVANIGSGGVKVFNALNEIMHGSNVLQDVYGIMTISKLTEIIWQSSERGASVFDFPQSQPQIDTVVMLAASITDGVVSGKSTLIEKMFANNGLTIDVKDESTGGRHVDEIEAHWNTVKANYAVGGDKVLCLSHCLGNDISGLHPYSSTTIQQRDSLKAEVDSLTASISANGNLPVLVESTFRGYDSSLGSDYTWHNEENGSKPFNENILYPAAEILEPDQWIKSKSKPYMQSYNWSYNYGKLLLENSENRIHLSSEGSELLRRLWVDNISNMIKGVAPVDIEKLSTLDALAIQRNPLEVLIGEANTSNTGTHTSLPSANFWRISVDNIDKVLLPVGGYAPSSITLSSTADVLTHSTNSAFVDDGNYEPTLENTAIKYAYGYTASTDYVEIYKLSGYLPNQPLSIGMAAYKDSTENRRSEFMFNDDAINTLICNAANDSGSNVQWGDYTADANGEVSVKIRKTSGSYAHWNGMHVIPH